MKDNNSWIWWVAGGVAAYVFWQNKMVAPAITAVAPALPPGLTHNIVNPLPQMAPGGVQVYNPVTNQPDLVPLSQSSNAPDNYPSNWPIVSPSAPVNIVPSPQFTQPTVPVATMPQPRLDDSAYMMFEHGDFDIHEI